MTYEINLFEKIYYIENEKDLSLLLNKLKKDDIKNYNYYHWYILYQINLGLKEIIKTNYGLFLCLNELDENNTLFLLIKIKDILYKIIENSFNLSELLSKLYLENNKIIIIKILKFNGLEYLIKDINDLGNIFLFIYKKENQKKIIDLLDKDFIKKIFFKTNEIKIILNYLHKENKDILIDILGLNNLKNKIKNYQNLSLLLKGLTIKKSIELLKLFKKEEIISFFYTKKDLETFIISISDKKEKLFFNYIKNEYFRGLQ